MDISLLFKQVGASLLWIISIIAVVLIIREIVMWYWKINKIVRLLEKIERNTRTESIMNEEKKD